MTLKAILDSLDGLDESLAALYTEMDDGKFRLDVDGVENLPAVLGLASNKQKILDEKRELQKKLDALAGVDPAEYALLKKEKEDGERATLEKKGEFDKILQQTVDQHGKEIGVKDTRIDGLMAELKRLMIDNAAAEIITSKEFGGSTLLLMPHVRKRVRVDETDDGTFEVTVLAADEKTPLVASGSGDRATIKDLISEMRENESFGSAFSAQERGGSGAQENKRATGQKPGTIDVEDRTGFAKNIEDIAEGKVEVVGLDARG